MLAAISPHDDYAYAQQVYAHVYPHLRAQHVILIGVAHKVRNYPETHGKLVFDSFDAWHGPYGDVEIVPILVPYISFEDLATVADRLATVLAVAMKESGLILGEDVAILISSDSVHYGDADWGGRSYADSGVDGAGYDRAVARDLGLTDQHLTGELSIARQEALFRELVHDDVQEYRITWCGRFSVPFGLSLLYELTAEMGQPAPSGVLLRYGTTLDVTGAANLHHWVGFASIGFR